MLSKNLQKPAKACNCNARKKLRGNLQVVFEGTKRSAVMENMQDSQLAGKNIQKTNYQMWVNYTVTHHSIPFFRAQVVNQRNGITLEKALLLTGEINKDELFSLRPC